MEFNLASATPAELQERYVLAAGAPNKHPLKNSNNEFLDYYCEFDGVRMGLIQIFHNKTHRHITWRQFYPLCVHLTEEEVRNKGVEEAFIEEVGMDFLRYYLVEMLDIGRLFVVPNGLERKGLGTLAHTFIVRHLCKTVLVDVDGYTSSYVGRKSTQPRLISLLRRAGIEEMVDQPMPLEVVESRLSKTAHDTFRFQFSE